MRIKVKTIFGLNNAVLKIIDDLICHSKIPAINIRTSFMLAYNKYLLKDWNPFFIVAYKDSKPIGLLPLMHKTFYRKKILPYSIIRIYSSFNSDFSNIYGKKENLKDIVEVTFSELSKSKIKWNEIIFDNFLKSSNSIDYIKNFLIKNEMSFNLEKGKYYYIDLDSSWENITNTMSKKFVKRNVRAAHRRINLAGSWMVDYNPKLKSNDILERIFPIHIKRQAQLDRKSNFLNDSYKSFFIEVVNDFLEKNSFKSFWLYLNGEIIAYMIGFDLDGVFYWWNTAFDPEKKKYYPTRLLLYNVIKYLHENNFKEFNFMRGESDYKKKWTRKYRTNYRFKIKNNVSFYNKIINIIDSKLK